MRRSFFVFLILLVLLFSVFVISAKEGKSDKIEQKVASELQKEGKARVIVILKDSPTDDKKKSSGFRASQRDEIKNKIDGAKIKHDFSYSNAFSASLTEEEIATLSLDENVEQIVYDEPMYATLQGSVPLINATKTWGLQSNNINLTGAGETVCIIDTGVDYTHPDLGNCTPAVYTVNGTNESYILQSNHPYANNFDYTWSITKPGYSKIGVHFLNLSLECAYDYISVMNGDGDVVGIYSCGDISASRFWSPSVDGDTIYIRLRTDVSGMDYGFYIDQVINGTTDTTYNWNNCSKVIGGWDTYNYDPDPIDDKGHGTHVSGIVAANGVIKGVAPDAKIISIKALGSDGSGVTSDITAGIEWCTNRSEDFNISVISMSLGGSKNYTTYCDSDNYDNAIYSSAINAAVAKNISVVIASGNSYNFTAISSPGCIQNAIPVGSSTKSDGISSFSNRNYLVQIFAPGSSINSTRLTGGYEIMSGTSMATPTVAGAFAIINQFLRANGQTKTPQEIESVFNATGKIIHDSSSNLNFSRINVYDAIISLDSQKPSVNLISPSNHLINNSASELNLTFKCNATDLLLKNVTFYLWNSTSVYNQTSSDVSGASTTFERNLTGIAQGEYKWNCLFYDQNGNSASANSNFSLIYDKSIPNITLNSPLEGNSTTDTLVSFSYNVSDAVGLANCSLILNGEISAYNSSTIVSGTNTISKSLAVGSYNWSVNCTDLAGNVGNSSTRTLTIESPATYCGDGTCNGVESCSSCSADCCLGGGGGGSSSGGTTPKVYDITSTTLSEGYSTTLGVGDSVKFQSNGEDHTLKTNSVGANFADITIQSNPITLKLFVGESKKLNLSSKNYYDLYVKLESIKSGKANITIKSIYENVIGLKGSTSAKEAAAASDEKIVPPINTPTEKKTTSRLPTYAIIIIGIVLIFFVVYLLRKILRKRKYGYNL